MNAHRNRWHAVFTLAVVLAIGHPALRADDARSVRVYANTLKKLTNPPPILGDHPKYVAPITEKHRFEAPILVDDDGGELHVRAWRFSYNVRGIVEMPNRLKASATAVLMVHPWGIDDGQGWKTPEPAGVCDFCTPERNALAGDHSRDVILPFMNAMRSKVGATLFSLIGDEDPIRQKLYRSVYRKPTEQERKQGAAELDAKLKSFKYEGEPLAKSLVISTKTPVRDYFRQFPGLDAGPSFNGPGFWNLPVPVHKTMAIQPDDVVIYDPQGYGPLKAFLQRNGIRHVLLTGYATDMCFARTTAGYENLAKDFNVFLVGDATLATFPANDTPRHATNAHISFASLNHLVTQTSWVRYQPPMPGADAKPSTTKGASR